MGTRLLSPAAAVPEEEVVPATTLTGWLLDKLTAPVAPSFSIKVLASFGDSFEVNNTKGFNNSSVRKNDDDDDDVVVDVDDDQR
ncbi:hypothetical protein ElyMa_002125900 [Elysia marginata]|uniref:Uncharacterized protein n=1 Tax=Elysia marginata TaxID=1093978 RepID=A0AAV4FJ22_9GAST|nr:hypothetical protein ElyMa_002125900 [Elysia marginata]